MEKSIKPSRKIIKSSRKQQRQQKRKEKKLRKLDFFSKNRKSGQYVLNPNKNEHSNNIRENDNNENLNNFNEHILSRNSHTHKSTKHKHIKILSSEEISKKDSKEQKKLAKQMIKQRNNQLLEANKDEDRIIRQLEKQLGLKKRKSKTLPKSFFDEGLNYVLDVCDPERMKYAIDAEKELNDNLDFEEDFKLMTGKPANKIKDKTNNASDNKDEDWSNDDFDTTEEDEDFSDELSDCIEEDNEHLNEQEMEYLNENYENVEEKKDEEHLLPRIDISEEKSQNRAKKRKKQSKKVKETKKPICKEENINSSIDGYPEEYSDDEFNSNDEQISDPKKIKGAAKVNEDGTWEDIYGRLRCKDGSIITEVKIDGFQSDAANKANHEKIQKEIPKYVPPAVRYKPSSDFEIESEKIIRLKRQLKGLLNRLAESNMHSIATQMEELYMNNSRNDMNDSLTSLMLESLVSPIITTERLLVEHILLISILHANVGTEVGAHFLQTIIRRFDECLRNHCDVENKTLDNIIMIIAQLYNFKIFDSKLMYEILTKLAESFDEKCIECILLVLRSVGFTLRKDDPIALKKIILELQKKAGNMSNEEKGYSRVKFLLEILLAIKNNNVTKIPNYDVSYSEHLKKVIKGLIRKGNYVTQLNISLEDLLKADERGRWWVVGSAWNGNDQSNLNNIMTSKQTDKYSFKLLELAKKQRMNTETRQNIFCIIMTAEDYLDAFEKLLKLALKNQQEREIINVILHCCLQEKKYNPYYSHLTQKFCDYDRKYQMIIKYSIWDKLKALNEHSGSQISNLTKMLIHLFIEKGLPISTLKIIQFSELDKITLRFMRQILIGIILHEDVESCLAVFSKVSVSDEMKIFRESLRLFIHHFLLKNLKTEIISDDQKTLLEERAKMVEKVLASKELRI